MKFKAYEIINSAVERGVEWGVTRAFDNSEIPTRENIISSVEDNVMLALSEVIDYESFQSEVV